MVMMTMDQVNHEPTIAEIVKHCQTKFCGMRLHRGQKSATHTVVCGHQSCEAASLRRQDCRNTLDTVSLAAAATDYKPPSAHSEPVRECVRTISNPTRTALTSMTTLT